MNHAIIILGSSRSDGVTASAARRLLTELPPGATTILDVASLGLEEFRYGGSASRDGFRDAIAEILLYRHLVFATPVYWYAMSSPLKRFFDRLTDLLQAPDRALGRSLAGRDAWLIATGTDDALPAGFTEPFEKTAAYFGLRWRRECYLQSAESLPFANDQLEKIVSLARDLGRACDS